MRFLSYPKAMRRFLDDNGLGQNFWKNKDGGIEQSAISRYINGTRTPSLDKLEYIYVKMDEHLKDGYPQTFEEFLMSPEDQAIAHLERTYDYDTILDHFEELYNIAKDYKLDKWLSVIVHDYADAKLMEKDTQDLVSLLNDTIKNHEIEVKVLSELEYFLGRCYITTNESKLAVRHLEESVRLDDTNYHCKYYLGVAYIRLYKPEKALKMFDSVISSDDKLWNQSAKIQKAQVLFNSNRISEAKEILLNLNRGKGLSRIFTLNNIGECYLREKDYAAAEKYYKMSIEFAKDESPERQLIPLLSLLRLSAYLIDHTRYLSYYQEILRYCDNYPISFTEEVKIEIIKLIYLFRIGSTEEFKEVLQKMKKSIKRESIEISRILEIKLDLLEGISYNNSLSVSQEIKDEILHWY